MRSLLLVNSLLLLLGYSWALHIDFQHVKSIRGGAKFIASNIMAIYDGSSSPGIPGLFPIQYPWYESGLTWDSMIRYWALTGDTTYNDRISKALLFQADRKEYMPANQTATEGNDDQATWGLACLTAAEYGLPPPPSGSGVNSWVELAQDVFDSQVVRWDASTCGGGLRWQIFTFNRGYTYKNALSNGDFAQLAARLARYTGNLTYSDWAVKATEWSLDVGLINKPNFAVYDGADVAQDCSNMNKVQWTSNYGTYLSALAYITNQTHGNPRWARLSTKLFLEAKRTFASKPGSPKDNVLTEVACASHNTCTTDELAFRAILSRALANARDLAFNGSYGSMAKGDSINQLLRTSAEGAATQCSGGNNGKTCGSIWTSSSWDGTQGLGQDLSALEIILTQLPAKAIRTVNGTSMETGSESRAGSSSGEKIKPTSSASIYRTSVSGLMGAFGLMVALCT